MRGKILYALLGAAVATAATLALRRPGGAPLVSALPPSVAELAWERPTPEVSLDNVPMETAIQTLCRQAGVPVRWDSKALEAADVDLSKQVTLHRRGWPLGDLLLEGVLHPDPKAESERGGVGAALPDGDAILITSGDVASRRAVIRSYDVADLLPTSKDPVAVPNGGEYPPNTLDVRPEYPIELLKSFIQDTIAVDTWRGNGGSGGTIFCVGTKLVIVQSYDAHRQVRRLLRLIREKPPPPLGGAAPELLDWNEGLGRWVPHDADVEEMAMSAKIDHLRLDRAPFQEAIESIGRAAGVKVVLRRDLLEREGVPLDASVTLELRDVTLADALDVVLRMAPAGPRLGYTPEHGVVTISIRAETEKVTYTRVYNLADGHPAGEPLPNWMRGTYVFLDSDRAYEALARAITDSIDPDSWKDNGGTAGSLRVVGNVLVVTQTRENHQRVRGMLAALRAAHAPRPAAATRPSNGAATRPSRVFVPPEVER